MSLHIKQTRCQPGLNKYIFRGYENYEVTQPRVWLATEVHEDVFNYEQVPNVMSFQLKFSTIGPFLINMNSVHLRSNQSDSSMRSAATLEHTTQNSLPQIL